MNLLQERTSRSLRTPCCAEVTIKASEKQILIKSIENSVVFIVYIYFLEDAEIFYQPKFRPETIGKKE